MAAFLCDMIKASLESHSRWRGAHRAWRGLVARIWHRGCNHSLANRRSFLPSLDVKLAALSFLLRILHL